jgi:hypothetical protein
VGDGMAFLENPKQPRKLVNFVLVFLGLGWQGAGSMGETETRSSRHVESFEYWLNAAGMGGFFLGSLLSK